MKGWRNLPSKVLFSRILMASIAIFLQIFIIAVVMFFFASYAVWFLGGYALFSLLVVVRILNENENPAFKLSWMVIVLIFPILGLTFYLIVQFQIGARLIGKRLRLLRYETLPYLVQDNKIKEEIKILDRNVYNYTTYMKNVANYPMYKNTNIKYFPLGELMYEDLLIELKKAKKYIFLEYFIIANGKMWDSILEILKEKIRDGIEVRVMYDGTCSFSTLPVYYTHELREFGIKAKQYAPIKPIISTHYNYRDHRKILIIDGLIAYTGGINLADEYINEIDRHGHWKDTAVKLSGQAVDSFVTMFLEMWNIKEKDKENYSNYFGIHKKTINSGYVLPFGSSPLEDKQIGEFTYMEILNTAKEYVHIITPYFIVDNEMMTSLINAALKGIDVKLIVPCNSDNETVALLGRTYFKELLEAGVKIYEYLPGFTHAKQFVSDGEKAVVGTINMDYRSLYLHFECAVFMYKHKVVNDVERDFQETLKKCREVTVRDLKSYCIVKRFMGRVMRLFAPLM